MEFSVSLQMRFLSRCLSLTWILIGFWGQAAIEITVTRNLIANSVLCKPFIGKMVLDQLQLTCFLMHTQICLHMFRQFERSPRKRN